MTIEAKHILIAILVVTISAIGYYFLVQRPQEIRLKCTEVAKDFRQKDTGDSRLYGSLQNDGYFINQSLYNDCIEKAGAK